MNPELEKTIDSMLANGELSDRSRELLMKKAEQLGVDLLDFELELESKIAKMKSAKVAQTQMNEPPKQSNKEGDLKKCPSCGAPVESFNTKCVECGHEFRNINHSQSVEKLFDMLNELESQRPADETNPLKALGSLYAKAFSGSSIMGGSKHESQKSAIIRNFPISNTKEDILEFLSLAVPMAKKKGGSGGGLVEIIAHNKLVPTWHSKCEQIIMKARFSMKEDNATLSEIEFYAKQLGIK